jgi:hypothetical protein
MSNNWPELPLEEWKDTCATLHMWTQIVGKVRLAQTPLVNHWWNVPLYVSARGMTTTAMPYGEIFFEMEFDFIDHALVITCSHGKEARVTLEPKSVATFYRETMDALRDVGVEVHIWKMPVEIPDPIAFDEDEQHASYDRDYVNRFWQVLRSSERVMQEFRSRFIGKSSPVHFFWGSFDLAVTRFSGRRDHPRGLFTRSDQSRLVAWTRPARQCGVLLLHRTCAGRFGRREGPAGTGVLQRGDGFISLAVRGCAKRPERRRNVDEFSSEHVRSWGEPRKVGSPRPRTSRLKPEARA